VIRIKNKTEFSAEQEDLLVDLTLHSVPASLIAEFAEKIVRPYYSGNLNAAVQDLIIKTLSEQEFVHSHITSIRSNKGSKSR
jgi:tagatose-1,6-bisphosphate aldolase non-catalytic subunit AgaZ/GatZ